MKLIKHSWLKLPGFRVHKCPRCKWTRQWNGRRLEFISKWGKKRYSIPPCLSTFLNDKI